VLKETFPELYLKAGTCAQFYFPIINQRFSADLDFNANYGTFYFDYKDAQSGTITFTRIVPTKLNLKQTLRVLSNAKIRAQIVKIQINIKHHQMPACKVIKQSIKTYLESQIRPKKVLEFLCLSPSDIFADKLLASAKSDKLELGRVAFKR